MNNLAINLRILRDKKKMTQAQVSEKLKLGEKVLSNYENGKREPDADMILDLADFYGVTADELLRSNSETEEYRKRLDILQSKYLNADFSGMIANNTLWKKYQEKIETQKELFKKHSNDPEWFIEHEEEKFIEHSICFQEAEEKALQYDLGEALKDYENLLIDGASGAFESLLSVLKEISEIENASMEYICEVEEMEAELALIETISVYCAIAHSSVSASLKEFCDI